MSTNQIKSVATLLVLTGVNAVLLYVAITGGFALWTIGVAALLGAAIGVFHENRRYGFLGRVLAGTAGGLFVYIGLMMSVVGRLLR